MSTAPAIINDTYSAALDYLQSGISVIPSGPDKLPKFDMLPRDAETSKATWKPFQIRLATDNECHAWWGDCVPRAGIARIHGVVSGNLETIDFDPHSPDEQAVIGRWRKLVEEMAPGLLIRLTEIETPRPGAQFVYRCEVPVEGNQELAEVLKPEAIARGSTEEIAKADDWNTLIETRGEGGYAVSPGTLPKFIRIISHTCTSQDRH